MISFDLAKKLRDAGFPQDGHFYYSLHTDPPTRWDINVLNYKGLDATDLVLCPTLEELIKACRKDFDYLMRSDKWYAVSDVKDGDEYISAEGATMTTAVAQLWLVLK